MQLAESYDMVSGMLLIRVFALVCLTAPAFSQKLMVKVVDRHESQSDYSYVVPGYATSHTNANANCAGVLNTVNCSGGANTGTVVRPAQLVPYQVRGATLALALPDGRIAVVNCESKFAERFAGRRGNHRSCRVPLVDEISADFSGDKAKLSWSVSLDGKKLQSETYKVLGVLPKTRVQ